MNEIPKLDALKKSVLQTGMRDFYWCHFPILFDNWKIGLKRQAM